MLADVLAKLGVPRASTPSTSATRFLRKHKIPEGVVSELSEGCPAASIRIGPLTLYSLEDIAQSNEEKANRPCIKNGLLIIGHGINGDPLAIEMATAKVVFVSHDLLWEESYDDLEECIVRSGLDLSDFWARASNDPTFPRDSYDAREGRRR